MAEMSTLWDYEEKLLQTILELENVKAQARNELMKNKEYIEQLIDLLKFVIQERDEARMQLQNLLNKPATGENFPRVPLFNADSPVIKQGKANSSITGSNSTENYYSNNSSPVEPFLNVATSPEFSNINLVNNNQFVQHLILVGSKFDEGSMIIDNLAKGKVLPLKGKLLQAVLGAGPLFKTLLSAAPLPRWRNPPQLQNFQIPLVPNLTIQAPNVGHLTSKQTSSSVPMFNFGNAATESPNGYLQKYKGPVMN